MDTTTLKIRTSIADNLDIYADGDTAFRNELKGLMIKDLEELTASLQDQGNSSDFNKSVHKIKVTLEIINCREFFCLIDELGGLFSLKRSSVLADKLPEFYTLCGCVIAAIREESFV